ncbi:hypothetical protein Acr_03g0020110 [Actinidia rufa]|uniref:Uncharacterized protein n=1 Tax=Actinidia rufa TaxID=165716 RepID=A0A7J0EHX0_9ERIC|nr:hypothetical protein Acr_03g0020110 [Actinidia rufa]
MGCGKSKLAVATEKHIAKTKSKESSEVSTQKENVETIPDKVINDTNVAVEKEKDEGEKESKNVDSKDNVQESEGTKEETLGGVIEETKNENNDNVDSKGGDDEKDANELMRLRRKRDRSKKQRLILMRLRRKKDRLKNQRQRQRMDEPMKDDVEGEKEPELAAVEPEAPTTTNEEEKTPEAPEGPTTTTTDAEEEKTSEAN